MQLNTARLINHYEQKVCGKSYVKDSVRIELDGRIARHANRPKDMPDSFELSTRLFKQLVNGVKKTHRPANEVLWANDEAVLVMAPSAKKPFGAVMLDRTAAAMLDADGILSRIYTHMQVSSGQPIVLYSASGRQLNVTSHLPWWEAHRMYCVNGCRLDLRECNWTVSPDAFLVNSQKGKECAPRRRRQILDSRWDRLKASE